VTATGDELVEQFACLLADALAPRLAPLLSNRAEPDTDGATAALITLDQLIAELPAGKRPQTWKRWLYERSRRNQIPGCRKLGGRLFFDRTQALDWLIGPQTAQHRGQSERTG
jgi:hypothetical protein